MSVFVSYAKEDVERVRVFYKLLKKAEYHPWMDEYNILPGQNWKFEIEKASTSCNAVILFLSKSSVSKTGYVHAELAKVLDQQKLRPEGAIYLIPARLDACEYPHALSEFHYVDLFEESDFRRICEALDEVLRQQSAVRQTGEQRGEFTVLTKELEESWEGLLGYSVSVKYPELHSNVDSQSCQEVNSILKAWCLSKLYHMRSARITQEPARFVKINPELAVNKEVMEYRITFISNAAISIVFPIRGYGAGGAHGYATYMTMNLRLQPTCELPLHAFFNRYNYVEKLGELTREALRKKAWERYKITFDEKMLKTGTEKLNPWDEPLFTFDKTGVTLYFKEYQIGPYAIGTWDVTLPFDDLREILQADGLDWLISVP